MSTTELYVEQVLIGFLVIAALLMPWLPEVWSFGWPTDTIPAIIGGSVVLGLAFLIGVPFDRLADTLTERLERFGLLLRVFKKSEGKGLPPGADNDRWDPDPYPENEHLMAGLTTDEEMLRDRLDYHRARIRLSRALAVYAPALTATTIVGLWRYGSRDPRWGTRDPLLPLSSEFGAWLPYLALLVVVLFYFVWMRLVVGGELPRTNDPTSQWVAVARGLVRRGRVVDPVVDTPGLWLRDPRTFGAPAALFLVMTAFVIVTNCPLLMFALFMGFAGCALSAWSWWRITETYRSFIRDVYERKERTPSRGVAPGRSGGKQA